MNFVIPQDAGGLEAIAETDGCAKAVSDEQILAALGELAREEGAFVCPEGAAIYAAAKALREEGWIREQDRVVLLNTGAGIKYPDTLNVSVPYLETFQAADVSGSTGKKCLLGHRKKQTETFPQKESRTRE